MTTLQESLPGADEEPEPVMPSGTAVALEAAGIGLVAVALVVLLAWATDSRSSASTGDALRVAAQGWLLAHQVPLAVEGGRLGLVPAGLALLPVLLLARAGAALARVGAVRRLADLRPVVGCLALPYAAVAGVVALFARTDAATPHPVLAAVAAGAHAVLAGGAGAAVRAGLLPGLRGRVPAWLRGPLRAGAVAVGALLGSASLLLAFALVLSLDEVARLAGAVAPGVGGAVGLFLLGLAVVPNALVWAAAYLVGPGVGLGEGSSVTVAGTVVDHVPALPLLAVLPDPGAAPPGLLALLVVPLLAGLLAGRCLTRRPEASPARGRLAVALTAAVVAAVLAVLAVLAGGPVGPGLDPAGPSAWQLPLVAAAEVGLAALVVVEVTRWRRRRLTARRAGSATDASSGVAGATPAAAEAAPGRSRADPDGG